MNQKIFSSFALALGLFATGLTAQAQSPAVTKGGGISPQVLKQIRAAQPAPTATRAWRNALAGTSINQLAKTADNPAANDTYFSDEVRSKGVTDQQQSGIERACILSSTM